MEEMEHRIKELNLNEYQEGYFAGLLGAISAIQTDVFDLLDAYYKGRFIDNLIKEQGK